MEPTAIRRWMIRWLLAVAAAHVIAGGLLPWLATAPQLDGYHDAIGHAFWGAAPPAAARDAQAWWLALFGPTVQLMALWMMALVHLAGRLRQRQVWLWLMAGLLLWAPQDIAVSLRAAMWPHVWIDLLVLAVLLPPLFCLWRLDRPRRPVDGHDAAAPIAFDPVKRSVLVTGATGFIGQKLVRALLRDGHQVTALSRDPQRAARLFDGEVRCIAAMDALPPGHPVDVVINLAGSRILGPRWSARRQQALQRSRAGLTDGVVAWIARARLKPLLMLSASAIGYYGIQEQSDATALDETAPPQPVFMSDLCSAWEAAAGAAARHGVRVECMRFGLVLGRQGALPMLLLPIRLGLGGRLGGGRQWLSWIHVDDVVAGISHRWRRALGDRAQPGVGVTNFTAPEQVTQAVFSQVAARVWRRPCLVATPGWPLRLALGEQADLLLEGQRVAPARLLREGFVFRYPGLAAALRSLR